MLLGYLYFIFKALSSSMPYCLVGLFIYLMFRILSSLHILDTTLGCLFTPVIMFFAVSKQFSFIRSLSFIHLLQLVLMSVLLKSCLAHFLPFPPSDSGCQASCRGPWSIWSCFVQVRNLTLFFTDNYGVWPAPFVKVAVFSLMCIFGLLVKKKSGAVGA